MTSPHPPFTSRRGVLLGLGAAALSLGCRRSAAQPGPVAHAACPEGATPGAVTGPFPPGDFQRLIRGAPNPGPIVPVSETDFDLTRISGQPGVPRGQVVRIRGVVRDATCAPIAGADLMLWQADAAGHYNHNNEGTRVSAADIDPGFAYWGRARSDAAGRFTLLTIVPGAYPAGARWWRPPHLHWRITAPGRGTVTTQSFFDGDVLDGIDKIRQLNQDDHILNVRQGFEGTLSGDALETARARLRDEMVARFSVQDQLPTGELVFYLPV